MHAHLVYREVETRCCAGQAAASQVEMQVIQMLQEAGEVARTAFEQLARTRHDKCTECCDEPFWGVHVIVIVCKKNGSSDKPSLSCARPQLWLRQKLN